MNITRKQLVQAIQILWWVAKFLVNKADLDVEITEEGTPDIFTLLS